MDLKKDTVIVVDFNTALSNLDISTRLKCDEENRKQVW